MINCIKYTFLLLFIVLVQNSSLFAAVIEIDFEDLTSPYREDETKPPLNIGDFYSGVTFGPYVVGVTKPAYDFILYPPHSGNTAVLALNATSNALDTFVDSFIEFSNPVEYVSGWFTASHDGLIFEVLDVGNNVLNSQSISGNYGSNTQLSYLSDTANIYRLRINALQNHWIMDDLSYGLAPSNGVIPEPSTLALISLGLLGLVRRRQR